MKTTIKVLLLSVFVAFSGEISGQGETGHWYFGYGYGMNFMEMTDRTDAIINGVPNQTLTDVPTYESGPINTWEGCFSISDKNGNYLFSSDGTKVYDKNKNKMKHGDGLLGDPSAAQSGIVLPRPGFSPNYYIITVSSYDAARDPIMYYEVDLSLDGGNGDVLGPYTGMVPDGTALNFNGIYPANDPNENLATIGHDNGVDYWLVHRLKEYIFVWHVTKDGIDPTPTHCYHIPATSSDIYDLKGGYLKFAPGGRYLGGCCYAGGNARVFVADFNTETGIISNLNSRTAGAAYAFSFSPDGNYLYYANIYGISPPGRLSVKSIMEGPAEPPLVLSHLQGCNNFQLGFDNRLYGMQYLSNSRLLYIIPNPNDETPRCVTIPDFFPAPGIKPFLGLPTFSSTFYSSIGIQIIPRLPCRRTPATFSAEVIAGIGSSRIVRIEWDFGDGSPIVTDSNMNETVFTHQHTYDKDGIYTVSLRPYRADGSLATDKIQTREIKVNPCMMPVNPNIHMY